MFMQFLYYTKVVQKVVQKIRRDPQPPFLTGFAQFPRVRSRSPAFLRAVSLDLSGFLALIFCV